VFASMMPWIILARPDVCTQAVWFAGMHGDAVSTSVHAWWQDPGRANGLLNGLLNGHPAALWEWQPLANLD
jgi:hypothetical protein